jgi:ActR/RegA family two-component response regulator
MAKAPTAAATATKPSSVESDGTPKALLDKPDYTPGVDVQVSIPPAFPHRRVTADCSRSVDSLGGSKEMLTVALPEPFCAAIIADAARIGYQCHIAKIGDDLRSVFVSVRPELAIVNIDAPGGMERLAICRGQMGPSSTIAAVTEIPCLLRAGEAVRSGASFVLARPTTLSQVISILDHASSVDLAPMSLDRAIWEYLNQTLAETGSIAGAARRLRLDRTSFKRMLRKRPPVR